MNESRARISSAVAAIMLIASLGACSTPQAGQGAATTPDRRDFMFQVMNVKTPNQGGQTLNLYFHYRYTYGLAEDKLPDYLELRKTAMDVLGKAGPPANPFWETVSAGICQTLKTRYPIAAISCEVQVHDNPRAGTWSEPGTHASIHTIGDIEPLAIPAPGQN